MSVNIPQTDKKRIVIIGGGFAGLKLANALKDKNCQLVLLDKENYHQFQPLLYQVATSGLEPGAIAFPFRKDFQRAKNFYFRLATVDRIVQEKNLIKTSIGEIAYDYLVVAVGTETNYFSMENIRMNALPMKSVAEALAVRNKLLINLEEALSVEDPTQKQALLNIVIVGGGATGVEIAGAISEMKRYAFGKDYPDLNMDDLHIYLLEGSPALLRNMSKQASAKALQFLQQMGVNVLLNTTVTDYTGESVLLQNGKTIPTKTLLWVSGVTGQTIEGLPPACYRRGQRIAVDEYNRIEGFTNIFAIGDICFQCEEKYAAGHPQVAQVAIQQGKWLAKNIQRLIEEEHPLLSFHYNDKGSLATIGRNRAVADLSWFKSQGLLAWIIWSVVHLLSILGVKNKIQIITNWLWSYITYDQSLRLIIRPEKRKNT